MATSKRQKPAAPATDDPKMMRLALANANAVAITLAKERDEALVLAKTAREMYETATAERDAARLEVETYETAERIRLGQRLVLDAGHAPARVWMTLADEPFKLARHLEKLTTAELRDYVAAELGAQPGARRLGRAPQPPKGETFGLDAREIAICKQAGCPPQTFAALKERREGGAK